MLRRDNGFIPNAVRLLGAIWLLSWFGLYLEIYRYHHVTLGGMIDVLCPSSRSASVAGGFVRNVVLWSFLAPPLAAALHICRLTNARGRVSSHVSQRRSALPVLLVGSGMLQVALGMMNQVIRHPPFVVDLTLRTGNGGFVVIGLVFIAAGIAVHRRAPSCQNW